jgi:glycosyltransferase involved in cell wall biosynthesis
MRLAVVISSLGLGGAEAVACRLAAGWAGRGWRVRVITLAGREADFFHLPPEVERAALGLAGESAHPAQAAARNLARLGALRRALAAAAPRVVVSFMDSTNVLTLLAAAGLGAPVVVTEHTDLRAHAGSLPAAWRLLRRAAYRRAAAVVGVSRGQARQLAAVAPARLVQAIPNPVEPDCSGPAELELDGPTVLGLGRLAASKGFHRLVEAFARCRQDHPGWRLAILGEGPERPRLEALGRQLGLGGALRLPGAVRRPGPVLAQGEAFALCSDYEAFPVSLVEAMACGLAPVVADYPAGPAEIFAPEREGLLVPAGRVDALARALARLMADPELRRRLGANAAAAARRYSPEAVLDQWDRLLGPLAAGGRP